MNNTSIINICNNDNNNIAYIKAREIMKTIACLTSKYIYNCLNIL